MLYLQSGKSQSSLLILLGVVGIFSVMWIFSLFTSSSFYERSSRDIILTKLNEYVNYIKGFSREALLLAVHAATKQIGAGGGEVSAAGIPRSWICNADVSPSVESVRFFLSEQTKNFIADYFGNLDIEEIITVNVSNFTCIDYSVSQTSIFSGKNDEEFEVGGYGGKILVNLSNNFVVSDNEVYQKISQNRFWYLYRQFKEWAPMGAEMLVSGMCGCLKYVCGCPSPPRYEGYCEPCDVSCPQFQSCLKKVLENAREVLQEKFDEYVKCEARLIGCYHELERCKGGICEAWNAPKCNTCTLVEPGELCSKTLPFEREYEASPLEKFVSFQGGDCGKCESWAETRGAMEAVFSCTDEKYYLSTKGDRRLTFAVYAQVSMRKKNCKKVYDCVKEVCEKTNCRMEEVMWKEKKCEYGWVERIVCKKGPEGQVYDCKPRKVKVPIKCWYVTKKGTREVCDEVCRPVGCYTPPQCCTLCK